MVEASHPRKLLNASLVSSSLAAAIISEKYVNAVLLYCLEKDFERYGFVISRLFPKLIENNLCYTGLRIRLGQFIEKNENFLSFYQKNGLFSGNRC